MGPRAQIGITPSQRNASNFFHPSCSFTAQCRASYRKRVHPPLPPQMRLYVNNTSACPCHQVFCSR
jgi:hypothetical protein